MNGEFNGLVAIVTGGASGIGRSTARLLLDEGAQVAVLDVAPTNSPDGAVAVRCDVSDRAAVDRAVSEVVDRFGGIDIVCNNAGIGAIGTVADNDDSEWARVFDINVTGMARVTAAALPYLRLSRSPAIVNTCSVAARNGLPLRALYSASKGAVLSLTLAMAADHLREGIRVNAVSPGTAATPWVDRLLDASEDPEAERRSLTARQPLGRLIESDEIARAIVYLANPSSASTTGVILDIDGGLSAVRLPSIGGTL